MTKKEIQAMKSSRKKCIANAVAILGRDSICNEMEIERADKFFGFAEKLDNYIAAAEAREAVKNERKPG